MRTGPDQSSVLPPGQCTFAQALPSRASGGAGAVAGVGAGAGAVGETSAPRILAVAASALRGQELAVLYEDAELLLVSSLDPSVLLARVSLALPTPLAAPPAYFLWCACVHFS